MRKNKKISLLLSSLIGLSLLYSCGTGNGTDAIYIIASPAGQCNPMTEGSCAIDLTFNTNGVANLSIGYFATPQNQPAYSISTASCVPQGTFGTQTCTINVNYNPVACTPGNQNEAITFTLANSQSNSVPLSCNY